MFRVFASKASSVLRSLTATSSSSQDLRTEPSKSGTSPQVRADVVQVNPKHDSAQFYEHSLMSHMTDDESQLFVQHDH